MDRNAPTWMSRGLNIAGIFDRRDSSPVTWPSRDEDLNTIAAAGFTHVRLALRWWGHADHRHPYRIDERFADQVDHALTAVTRTGLGLVLSMHHADEVMSGDRTAVDRLCNLWRQIAARYRASGAEVAYDLLNEPRAPMTPDRWNTVLPRVLGAVRDLDSARLVIVGGAEMSTLSGLTVATVPPDEHMMLTFHYYEPFPFTHQGASWEPGSADWRGTRWGTAQGRARVVADLDAAASFAATCGVALYLGEFGTLETADLVSRAAWTRTVRTEAERLGMAWACWDYQTDFGVNDPRTRRWRPDLFQALTD